MWRYINSYINITILYGGHFAILATGVGNLTIDNLKIDTKLKAQYVAGTPIFVVKDISNFTTFRCKDLKDVEIQKLTTKNL